ncbi:MAG: nucleotidyltransferase family protein [Candidatus Omnitrophica bacterium]|nr:nucleotidyltransferase family protein [Candidatus Omnitrophota bacterium]
MISTILLAAGLSSRFGSPKPLVKFNNEHLIILQQQLLLDAGVDEIIVVLGAFYSEIKPYVFNHKRIKLVYNKDYKFGQTSSFKAGLSTISQKSSGIMLFPVDYPVIKKQTIINLMDVFKSEHPQILIPVFNGKKGHPPIFDISLKNDFERLNIKEGLNTVAWAHAAEIKILDVDDQGVINSFNTQDELKNLMR